MDPPKIKKDYPCGRQCIFIVKNKPWSMCECKKYVIL